MKAADRLFRPMYVFSNGQRESVDVRGSRVASTVGCYHAAVGDYLTNGNTEALERFRGKRVAGVELETDPEVLDALARRGEFDFDSIYRDFAE